MYNISIGRLADDSDAQGVIRPADESWQLVIDKDGYPHLYVRVKVGDDVGEGDFAGTGLFCVEDLMPDDAKIRDIMQSTFEGKLTPEEEEAAHAEYLESRKNNPIPCPR